MEVKHRDAILDELTRKSNVFTPDENTLLEISNYFDKIEPKGIITKLPDDVFETEKHKGRGYQVQHLSFRRLINNNEVKQSYPSVKQRLKDFFMKRIAYDSDIYLRELLSNRGKVELINDCIYEADKGHFSEYYCILGKSKILTIERNRVIGVKKYPLLILPERDTVAHIWENRHK